MKPLINLLLISCTALMLSACEESIKEKIDNFGKSDTKKSATDTSETSVNTANGRASVVAVISSGVNQVGKSSNFTITGTNLSKDLVINIKDCDNLKYESVSTTKIEANCTPNSSGYKTVTVQGSNGVNTDVIDKTTSKPIKIAVFDKLPQSTSNLPQTGRSTCANGVKDNLACLPEELADMFTYKQDAQIQSGQPMAYKVLTSGKDTCIQDTVTGLIWEKKTDEGGVHDKDWNYSWYDSNGKTNGGRKGSKSNEDCAVGGCDSETFIKALNLKKYCGYDDWRLPTVTELFSLVEYGSEKNIKINPVFDNTVIGTYKTVYMTSNTYQNFNTGHYYHGVNFANGLTGAAVKNISFSAYSNQSSKIRAVRGQ